MGFWSGRREGFKEENMKCGVNAIPGWQLELVGNLVDLPLDRERTNVSGTQITTRQAETQIPGMAAKPGRLAGTWVLGHSGHLQSSYVSALPVRGGCQPSPTHSHSLGTNCQQLESLRALMSTERAGVGMHWKGVRPVVFCRGSSVHTLSMGGSGSSCIGLPGSMPGGNV